jgi:DtxR family Mn-dependent transcriptional regulator
MSESLEMYVATIMHLRTARDAPVPLSRLAEGLSIASVSANEMCRKLQEQGLVVYRPYKGVTLTQSGEKTARAVLRRRGMWTVFLARKLGIEPNRAREIADTLEHGTPDDVADRLADYLGNPRVTPMGTPIPPTDTAYVYPIALPLTALAAGQTGHVAEIKADATTIEFLHKNGLQIGTLVTVLATSHTGERLLAIGGANPVRHLTLTEDLVARLLVVPDRDLLDDVADACEEPVDAPAQVRLIPLSKLSKGESGVVVRVNSRGALRRRLLDMGMVTGEVITLKHRAPLGDPLEFTLKGYQISLRKEEAADIIVEVALCD